TTSARAFTGNTGPWNSPSMRFRSTSRPIEWRRRDAPTTATERGRNSTSTLDTAAFSLCFILESLARAGFWQSIEVRSPVGASPGRGEGTFLGGGREEAGMRRTTLAGAVALVV